MARITEIKELIPFEREEQKNFIKWVKLHPILRNVHVKIDNEGKRTPKQGKEVKELGLQPGASDLFFAIPSSGYHGLWIEMKRQKFYRHEPEQIEWINRMRANGYMAEFAHGFDEAKEIAERYLNGNNGNQKTA